MPPRHRRWLVVPLAVLALALPSLAQAEGERATITGTVFYDRNGDGVRNASEPGRSGRTVTISGDGLATMSQRTAADGSYSFDVKAGTYTVSADADDERRSCADVGFSLDPLARTYCVDYVVRWNATGAQSVEVTAAPGAAAEASFGAQPADAAVVGGRAVLQDVFAAGGTPVQAMIGGLECGSTTAMPANEGLSFVMEIRGDGEQPGCARPGDAVDVVVGGVTATEPYIWVASEERIGEPLRLHHALAMPKHAWYWFERTDVAPAAEGVEVEALVNGGVCGHGVIEVAQRPAERSVPKLGGFSRMIVHGTATASGCGQPGATVSFRVRGVSSIMRAAWHTGLERIDLVLAGDVDCSLLVDARDAMLLLQLEAGSLERARCGAAAGVNGDGRVDAVDAALVEQYDAGLLRNLPP